MRTQFSKFIYFIFLALLFSACNSWKNKEIKEEFNPLISGYTGGSISAKEKVLVNLSKEFDIKSIDSSKINELIDVYPSQEYKVKILTSTTLSIEPIKQWERGENYRFRVNLEKLYHNKEAEFLFNVFIKKQAFSMVINGYQPISTTSGEGNNLYGTIYLLEPEDLDLIKKGFEANQEGKKLSTAWNKSSNNNSYSFVIQDIKRGNSESKITINFNGSTIGSDNEGTITESIPAISTFKILNVINPRVTGEPFLIHFSDALNATQNFEGLFTLGDDLDYRVNVDKNIVSLYPQQELKSSIELIISASIKNYNGKILGSETKLTIAPHGKAPEVDFVSKGTIYPSDYKMIVPIKATNLRAITVRVIQVFDNNIFGFLQDRRLNETGSIKRYGSIVTKKHIVLDEFATENLDKQIFYGLDLSKLVKAKPGALYMISLSFRKEFSTLKGATNFNKEEFYKIIADTALNEKETGYFSNNNFWEDYSPDSDYNYETYNYDETNDPCSDSFYMQDHSASKMVLVSDIGIICNKLENNELNVVTSSISSTKPISGVEVKAYSYQNQVIGEAKTDGDGIANFKTTLPPLYIIATNSGEKGYLKFEEENKQVTTPFNTEGVFSSDHLKGYLYGDRGVWRPNDTLHLSFILQDSENRLPIGHPIMMQLYDTQGRVVAKELFNKNEYSIYTAHFHIPEAGATGYWRAEALVGNSKFDIPIRVETIKPNRLRIALDIENKIFNTKSSGDINLKGNWLSGLVAPNLKFDATYTYSKIENPFPQYSSYSFDNPFAKLEKQESSLANGVLNEKGEVQFNEKFKVDAEWGMVNAKVKVRLFESGGDFSTDFFSTKISPCDSYCGILLPSSNDSQTNGEIPIKLITLNELGNKVSVNTLSYTVYKVGYNFWYEDEEGTSSSDFISSRSHEIIKQGFVSTSQGDGVINFRPTTDYWATYFVLVTNTENENVVGTTFNVYEGKIYEGYEQKSNVDDAKLLSFKPEKPKYNVGETAVVPFSSVEDGRAIVSILKAGKIIKQEVIKTSGSTTKYEFDVTSEMVPNIYLSITTLQPYQNVKNDMPVRMYGMANIFIEDKESKLLPQIIAPEVIKPSSAVTIQVKEKNGAACDYTLAIVDEGILDLTHFKTPNPFDHFFQKEALSSEIYDLYNYVLGGYFGGFDKVFGIGGDLGSLGAGKNQKANRFKPMVKFVGPFHLKKNSTGTHKLDIPYYVGSVRVMAVAASEKSYGASESVMKVKNNFMILSSLPRVLSPNDEIEIPVTILSDSKTSQSVHLSVETSSHFNTLESLNQDVVLNEGEEKTVRFKFKIGSKLGVAKFTVTANSGTDKLTEDLEIEVRNPNSASTLNTPFSLNAGEEITLNVKNQEWSNLKATLELSTVKSLNLSRRLDYLIRYPHGCVEQTTSAAFPQIYLSSLMNLTTNRKLDIEQNVKAAIAKLSLFQKADGGLSYWPTGTYSDDWGSSYAGNFLIEAQRMGYAVPTSVIKNWTAYQSKQARGWSVNDMKTNHGYSVYSSDNQAYRLYTLALAQQPDLAAMNRLRTAENISIFAKWLLASSYATIGQTEVANNLVNKLKNLPVSSDGWDWSYGSEERDRALMLNVLVTLNRTNEATEIANYLSTRLNSSDYLNTQATAMALVSMANFYSVSNISKNIDATVSQENDSKDIHSLASLESIDVVSKSVKVKNKGDGKLFGAFIESGIPVNPVTFGYSKNISLQINYLDKDGSSINLDNIIQGSDIKIITTIKNIGMVDNYKNLALSQILPTGWEIRNMRLEGNEDLTSQNYTYQDIRDDRVFTYLDLAHGETKTITLYATANYKGTFYLPAVTCESMYSNNIAAQVVGQKISVK